MIAPPRPAAVPRPGSRRLRLALAPPPATQPQRGGVRASSRVVRRAIAGASVQGRGENVSGPCVAGVTGQLAGPRWAGPGLSGARNFTRWGNILQRVRGAGSAVRPVSSDLSTIQAGFFCLCHMTEFNCFWGLQSGYKQLSIYTVVLLCDISGLEQAEPASGRE